MNINSQIALIGATGKAGSVVLSELLTTGYKVKALVRDPSKLKTPENPLLDIIVGDITNGNVNDQLFREADIIINCLSNTGNPNPISSLVTKQVITRLQNNTNKRYFVVTGKTVKSNKDKFSLVTYLQRKYLISHYPDIVKDKQKEYLELAKSSINWTLIRCPLIIDGENIPYHLSISRCKGKSITKLSLAKFIIEEIEKKEFISKSPYLFN